jgi:hypothetical protein
MHSSSNRESLHLVAARSPSGDLLGSTLQLDICLMDCSDVRPGLGWASCFRVNVVNEAGFIQLIHWFDALTQPPVDVSSWSTEVVSRKMTLHRVVWRDVDGHADQNGIIG